MPGGTTTGRVRRFGVVTAGACLLAVGAVSPAGRATTIDGLRARDARVVAQTRSAVVGLYAVDARVAVARARLDSLLGRARALRAQRMSLAYQLRLARVTASVSQRRLAARVRYLYDHGSTSALEVVFGAKSLDDALTELDNLNRIGAVNTNVLHEAEAATSRLHLLRRRLAARERALGAATRAAAATAVRLAGARKASAAYVQSLEQRHADDLASLRRVEQVAQAAARRTLRVAVPAPAPVPAGAGSRSLTMVATGYSLPGRTATGLPVGWGIAAVDPRVIPLGTHLVVPGYGVAVAADTGGSVVGARVDLWFPSSAQARSWGRRSVTVALR